MKQISYSYYATQEERNRAVLDKTPGPISGGLKGGLLAMVALGIAGLALGVFSHNPEVMWGVLLVNFYMVAGITIGGPLFAALLSITNAVWGRPVKRFAEATIGFAPWLWLYVVLLFYGANHIWEWAGDHGAIGLEGAKSIWLMKPVVFGRVIVWLIALIGMAKLYVRFSVRPDVGLAMELDESWGTRPAAKYATGFTTVDQEVERTLKTQAYIAPWFAFIYAVAYAMLGYDLIMSIDPHWFSTMFGGWMFMANMYASIAVIGIAVFALKKAWRLDSVIVTQQHHDIGKLTFGAAVFWTYLMWSQYLIIWYGNLPEETGFVLFRTVDAWRDISYLVFAMCFFIPFLALIPKKSKLSPWRFTVIALVSLGGIWLNLYTLVMPNVLKYAQHHDPALSTDPVISIAAILVTIGTIGGFVLAYRNELGKFPIMPISDPYFEPPEEHI